MNAVRVLVTVVAPALYGGLIAWVARWIGFKAGYIEGCKTGLLEGELKAYAELNQKFFGRAHQ
jgi:ABC-type uncharacterized transport system permease subunit